MYGFPHDVIHFGDGWLEGSLLSLLPGVDSHIFSHVFICFHKFITFVIHSGVNSLVCLNFHAFPHKFHIYIYINLSLLRASELEGLAAEAAAFKYECSQPVRCEGRTVPAAVGGADPAQPSCML